MKGRGPRGRSQVARESEERSCARLDETPELRAYLIGNGKVATDDGQEFRGRRPISRHALGKRPRLLEARRRLRIYHSAVRRCASRTERVPSAAEQSAKGNGAAAARTSEDAVRKEGGRRAVGSMQLRSAREA